MEKGESMKTIIKLGIVSAAVALGTGALAASFTPGNIVVLRVGGDAAGNASGILTNRGNPLWIDEYSTDLVTRVQSIQLRTNFFGAYSP